MGKDAQLIFGGGGNVTLYDASNGYFNVGYLSDIELKKTTYKVSTSNSMQRELHSSYEFAATLLQTDDTTLGALDTRRNTLLTIYIVGAGRLWTLTNYFITYEVRAPFKAGEPQTVFIEGKSAAEFTQEINLLGTYGGFEADANSDGICDGWANSSLATYSREATFTLGSGTYCQQIEFESSTACALQLATAKVCPFMGPVRLTFSAQIHANEDVTFYFRIITYNTSDGAITTYTSTAITMSAAAEAEKYFSTWINESVLVKSLQVQIYRNASGSPEIQIDKAILNIENLRDYTED